jgi:hypothetical protein
MEVLQNNAFNEFAERAARIVEFDFEYSKEKLVNITTNERGAIVKGQR